MPVQRLMRNLTIKIPQEEKPGIIQVQAETTEQVELTAEPEEAQEPVETQAEPVEAQEPEEAQAELAAVQEQAAQQAEPAAQEYKEYRPAPMRVNCRQ